MRMTKYLFLIIIIVFSGLAVSCNTSKNKFQMSSYGYDRLFLESNNVKFVELKSADNNARLLIVPDYQGRVMTSSAGGEKGKSFGWINYKFIESGKKDPQFNVYGGEERFWLGPEGGPFSIYFKKGVEQVFENWVVPPVIDSEGFEIVASSSESIKFSKNASLVNASGTEFQVGIERTVSLLSSQFIEQTLNIRIPDGVKSVAYQTDNVITNVGAIPWTKEGGLLSIWLLSMFNPSPQTTVFIPYKINAEGTVVNDDYFGKVPADRLIVDNGTVYFKIDGKYRSKIGIPPARATQTLGSYDSGDKVLTLLWCSLPNEPQPYVNSKWGEQDDPYDGDAINSYNDGPVADGSIMGPFYEIETSSPAAELLPGQSMKHEQKVIHLQGKESDLAGIIRQLFGLSLQDIASKFN
jgi:hypothetical protein